MNWREHHLATRCRLSILCTHDTCLIIDDDHLSKEVVGESDALDKGLLELWVLLVLVARLVHHLTVQSGES